MSKVKEVPFEIRVKCYEIALRIYGKKIDDEWLGDDSNAIVGCDMALCANLASILYHLKQRRYTSKDKFGSINRYMLDDLSIEFPELAKYKPKLGYYNNTTYCRPSKNGEYWFNCPEQRAKVLRKILKEINEKRQS